jgi:transcriptional regulator with PAS, ATPase and Fis domain
MAAANNVSLSAERQFDSDGFKKKIKAAIHKARGSVTDAAKILGVSRRTMCRWLEESHELQVVVNGARKGK